MEKELEKKEEVLESSKSAVVLKTIYAILIIVIFINCVILISSILLKADSEPITSKHQIQFNPPKDSSETNEEVSENIEENVEPTE